MYAIEAQAINHNIKEELGMTETNDILYCLIM